MNQIKAKVLARSINPQGDELITYLLTYPRFIHSELMTHRMFSRNSASSRAIPFERMVKMVEEDPFIPIAWQKDHKGMQGSEYFTDDENIEACINKWLEARDCAIEKAKELNEDLGYGGVTKQLCNRLLEPFMWHTVLVTTSVTEESLLNFFELRCPKYEFGSVYYKSRIDLYNNVNSDIDAWPHEEENWWRRINKSQAEIHIQALAEAMWDARNESTPKQLKAGEWHLPFNDKIDTTKIDLDYDDGTWLFKTARIKIATARCARLSYNNHNGEIDYQKDIELHDRLLASHHMSPFEHCARAMHNEEYYSLIKGKYPTTKDEWGIVNYERYPYIFKAMFEDEPVGINPNNPNIYGWCNNFKGFIQYRYLIENNYDLQNFV